MTLATLREEPALAKLDEIEDRIAGLLTEGTLFPDRRAHAAKEIVNLHRQAVAISASPEQYQAPHPCDLEDPQERLNRTRQVAYLAFRDAPQQDPLTQALVEFWADRLHTAAASQDHDLYDRHASRMEHDAHTAAALKPEACTLDKPSVPQNPAAFLQALKALTQQAQERLPEQTTATDDTWRRAAAHALQRLLDTIDWVQKQGVDTRKDTTADRRAAAASVVALAEEFNQIRFAIRRRCAAPKRKQQ